MNIRLLFVILLFSLCVVSASAEELADPGILPDSPLYFVDQFFERVGDDPEKALRYQEEKIAEAHAMAEQKKKEYVEVALNNAEEYGEILEKEVTPDMEEELEDKNEILEEALEDISEELPELDDDIDEHLEQLKRTELAAKVSGRIKKLCETLSELDAVEYAKTCKAGEDAPEWHKKLDEKLTDEQKDHAKIFVEKMKQCMKTSGKECDCEGMGVQSFTALCKEKSSQAAACAGGNEEACMAMNGDHVDMSQYLPPYLIEAMMKLWESEDRDGEEHKGEYKRKFDLPPPCKEAGITSPNDCMKIMKEKGDFTEFEGEYEEKQKYRGQPERIQEFGRDCHAINELSEKVKCFEEFYNKAQGSFEEKFERKYEYEGYKPVMHDDWTSAFAQRWFAAQNDDEREQIKKEMYAEMEKRGIDPEHARTDFDEDEFEFEYEDESGTEYKNEYRIDSSGQYENRYDSGSNIDYEKHYDGEKVPMSDDEREKMEEYQKQYESGQYEQGQYEQPPVYEKTGEPAEETYDRSDSDYESGSHEGSYDESGTSGDYTKSGSEGSTSEGSYESGGESPPSDGSTGESIG